MARGDGTQGASSGGKAGIGLIAMLDAQQPAKGVEPAGPGAAAISIGPAPAGGAGESDAQVPIGIALPPSVGGGGADSGPVSGRDSIPGGAGRLLIREPANLNTSLAMAVSLGDQNACDDLLGISEDDVVEGRLDDGERLKAQIAKMAERHTLLETKYASLKDLPKNFPEFARWRDAMQSIGRASEPIEAFRAYAVPRRKERRFQQLLGDARTHWRDGVLEWREYEALRKFAEELGLSPEDCEKASEIAQNELKAQGRPTQRHTKPPPRTSGWRAYRVLGGGSDDLWGLDELLDAMIDNFPRAVEAAMEAEDKSSSLAAYLDNCPGAEAAQAHKVAVTARRAVLNDQLDPTVAVWQFLWANGRRTLHLDPKKQPVAKKDRRIENLQDLRVAVETIPSALDTLGELLTAGLLERWLKTVPQTDAAAATARQWREQLRAVVKSKLQGEQRRAVIETLWAAGLRILPLRHDGGKKVSIANNVAEVVALLERSPTWKFFGWALEAGVITQWVKLVEPARVDSTERARREGALGTASWLWNHGSRKLSLGSGQPTVESLEQLLQVTDSGDGVLLDEVVSSGELALWARSILRREDLAKAAEEVRLDGKGSMAERWRQQAGARTLKVKGEVADTPEAFARLALIAHDLGDEAEPDAPPAWVDIDAAVQSQLPERRFKAANPTLATNLEAIAGMAGRPRDRALAACLAAGLTCLPVSDGASVHVVVQNLEDLEARIHEPGLRAEIAAMLEAGVLMWWIPNCTAQPPEGLLDFVISKYQACRSATPPQKLAMVDAIVRFGLRRGTCYLAPGLAAQSYEELRAVALDFDRFAIMASAEVRERVRESCGAGQGMVIPGLSSVPSTLEETDLDKLPASVRAMAFAWEWLKVPVLWLGDVPYQALTQDDLVAHLGEPGARSAVREAAVSGLLGLWLGSQLGVEIPSELCSQSGMGGAGIQDSQFVRFALWLGDARPKVELTLERSRLRLEEGGNGRIQFGIVNHDPLRPAALVLHAAAEHLSLAVLDCPGITGGTGELVRLTVDPAASVSGSLHVGSVEGHAGKMSGSLSVKYDIPLQDAEASRAQVEIDVRFPVLRVLKSAGIGIAVGAVLASAWRGVTQVIFSQHGLLAMIPKGGALRDTEAETVIGVGLISLIAIVQRAILAKKYRLAPTSASASLAVKVMGWASLALAPIGALHGCSVGCGRGSGLDSCGHGLTGCATEGFGGAGLGLAIGLLVLLRPGAVYVEAARGLPQDIVFVALAATAVLAGNHVGQILTAVHNALDLSAVATVSALGFSPTLTTGAAFAGFALWGALLGMVIGLRHVFRLVERPKTGWLLFAALPSLLAALVWMRGTPDRMTAMYPNPPADASECRGALAHAMQAMKNLAPGVDPSADARFEAYKGSPAYNQELDRATELCVKRKLKKSALDCLNKASDDVAVRECNPFWMGGKP